MTAARFCPKSVSRITVRGEARAFFQRDRLMAAYALADIDAAEIEKARWWTATKAASLACALVVEALPFRPCFASGETEALATIFRDGIREPRIVVATPPAGRLAVEGVSLRARREDASHGRVGLDVPSAGTHGVTRLAQPARRRHRSLRACLAHVLHRGTHGARDLFRRVHQVGRLCPRQARMCGRDFEHRGRGNVLHASRVSRPRHGDVGDIGCDRGRARAAPRCRAQRASGQRAGDRGI